MVRKKTTGSCLLRRRVDGMRKVGNVCSGTDSMKIKRHTAN